LPSVLISLLLTLRGIVRSRAALHLEVLALCHQIASSPTVTAATIAPRDSGPVALGLPVALVERMANGARHRQAVSVSATFKRLMDVLSCWVLRFAAADGFTAEFPLTRGARSAILSEGVLQTALYRASITKHPHDGFGVATGFPLPFYEEARHDIANHLNVMETRSPDSHQLSAWCVDGNALSFVSFFAAFVFANGAECANALFLGTVWHQASRAFWANTVLAPWRRIAVPAGN
jgi:hypothetical protein